MKDMRKFMMIIMAVALIALPTMAQQQEWQSTSTMQGSGSAYSSQVTTVGATSVGGMATTTTAAAPSRPRRTESSDPWSGGNETTEEKDEGSPIGDALIPLTLLALAYALVVFLRKRKQTLNG